MFKMLVLQSLYNLSDDQTEYQVRDRLSFQRFLGLNPDDTMPDSKTLWLFREQLAQHGLVEKLFNTFDQQLWYSGFIPKGGQIIDASLGNVPKNRNKRQACLRPRDRFWDIPVPKIDSAFDNLFVPQPSWLPSTTQQLRKLVAAPYLAPI